MFPQCVIRIVQHRLQIYQRDDAGSDGTIIKGRHRRDQYLDGGRQLSIGGIGQRQVVGTSARLRLVAEPHRRRLILESSSLIGYGVKVYRSPSILLHPKLDSSNNPAIVRFDIYSPFSGLHTLFDGIAAIAAFSAA